MAKNQEEPPTEEQEDDLEEDLFLSVTHIEKVWKNRYHTSGEDVVCFFRDTLCTVKCKAAIAVEEEEEDIACFFLERAESLYHRLWRRLRRPLPR